MKKEDYLYELLVELEKQWPDYKTINIVCHGHSQVLGHSVGHTVDTFSSYPQQWLRLIKRRFPFCSVNMIVTAHGGECAISGCKRFREDVLTHNPDLVTIDYALNDRYADWNETKQAWEIMVQMCLEKNIPCLLLTPTLDIFGNENEAYDKIARHRDMVIEIARKYEVGLVDITKAWDAYKNNIGNLQDLLVSVNHASELGHSIISRELMTWIPYFGYE